MKQFLAVMMFVSFSGALGLAQNNEPQQISTSKQKLDELKNLGVCINLSGDHCAIVDEEGNLKIFIAEENPKVIVPGPAIYAQPQKY